MSDAPLDAARVRDLLRTVAFPGFDRDIVRLGVVSSIDVRGGDVRITLLLDSAPEAVSAKIREEIRERLSTQPGARSVVFLGPPSRGGVSALPMAASPAAGRRPSPARSGAVDPGLLPDVRHVVAVASGKGGVGKSTVAVNLGVSLAAAGLRVGLLDADVYGPSIPLMTGIRDEPRLTPERKLVPFERFGLRLMSIGFLVDPGSAVIFRGPMVMKALEQLLRDVDWGALDVLIVDMPPGTGDAQLTISQRIRLAGAVIVTTPQDVALADAIKGVAMFRKVGVPILGMIENMSFFDCPSCGERAEIFGHGGGRREAERQGVPFLGALPLWTAIRAGGDAGKPFALDAAESPAGRAVAEIAQAVRRRLYSEDA